MPKASGILEATFLLILVYLVLSMSGGMAQVTKSLGGVYVDSIRALQGR